jgi:lysyl-tRNA synthetase class 2
MNVLELSEQEIIRRNSLNELRAMGIEPYPAAEYVTNAFSTDIKAEFKDDEEPRKVSVAGRMMSSTKAKDVPARSFFLKMIWRT